MRDAGDERHPASSAGPLEDVRAARDERRAEFEREVVVHLDALYAFAFKLARSRHDAEDLVSDTMVRAFDHWDRYTLGTNARAWLFTILYHVFVGGKRAEARDTAIAEYEDGTPRFEVIGESDPESSFYDSIVDEEVTRAIDSLPEHYRTPVVLVDMHEFRYGEIAAILDIPEGTAKSRLFRGRKMLQGKLRRYALEMGYLKPRAA